jgi:hypothetical protein
MRATPSELILGSCGGSTICQPSITPLPELCEQHLNMIREALTTRHERVTRPMSHTLQYIGYGRWTPDRKVDLSMFVCFFLLELLVTCQSRQVCVPDCQDQRNCLA